MRWPGLPSRLAGLPGQFPRFRGHGGEFLFELPVEPLVLPSHSGKIVDREDEDHHDEKESRGPIGREPSRIPSEPIRRRTAPTKTIASVARVRKKSRFRRCRADPGPRGFGSSPTPFIRKTQPQLSPDATKFHASGLFIRGQGRYIRRMPPARLKVLKTYKLFIGGKSPAPRADAP